MASYTDIEEGGVIGKYFPGKLGNWDDFANSNFMTLLIMPWGYEDMVNKRKAVQKIKRNSIPNANKTKMLV